MRLIIQIPCLNEAGTIGVTLSALPKEVPGFESVEWLIIDDGSTDGTVEEALRHGAHHVRRHTHNRGLAEAFMTGIDACLELGADVIVNTDADNQYDASAIHELTRPIVEGRSDMVIGARPIDSIEHFSATKRLLQKLGSRVVRSISQTDVADAPSGFRAISKEAALRLVVFGNYTYTLESIIQLGLQNKRITNVPVAVNEDLRPSRLLRSVRSYVLRSGATILRIFLIYRPARLLGWTAIVLLALGLLLGARFVVFFLMGDGDGNIQSLILTAILMTMGFQALMASFLADVIAANRRLLEELRYQQRKFAFDTATQDSQGGRADTHSNTGSDERS
jgi:glycosyltransferase involved in cell wall biosynthesis